MATMKKRAVSWIWVMVASATSAFGCQLLYEKNDLTVGTGGGGAATTSTTVTSGGSGGATTTETAMGGTTSAGGTGGAGGATTGGAGGTGGATTSMGGAGGTGGTGGSTMSTTTTTPTCDDPLFVIGTSATEVLCATRAPSTGWSATVYANEATSGRPAAALLDAQTGIGVFYQPPGGQAGMIGPVRQVTLANGVCGALSNAGSADTKAAPTLTVLGSQVQMVFRGSGGAGQDRPIRWSWTQAAGWQELDAPIPNVLLPTTPGIAPNGTGLAANGAELLIAHGGYDTGSKNNLYVARYSAGWPAAEASSSGETTNVLTPVVAALDAGTWLVVFHSESGSVLSWATTNGTALPAANDIAGTDAAPDTIALTKSAGGAVLAYRTNGNKLRALRYTTAVNTWAALPDLPGDPAISGAPAVAPGVCTHEVELVYIEGGLPRHRSFEGGAWSAAVAAGAGPVTGVAIAAVP